MWAFLVLFSAMLNNGETSAAKLAKYDARCEEARQTSLATLQKTIALAGKGQVTKKASTDVERIKEGFRYRSQASKKQHLEQLEKLREQIQEDSASKKRDLALDPETAKVGDVGVLIASDLYIKVMQVINDKEMLIEVRKTHVQQKPYRQSKTLFWVTGTSTDGIVDDQQLMPESVFEVTGTKRYDTAGGASRTVFVLAPLIDP